MKPVADTMPRLTNDGLAVMLDGRTYGAGENLNSLKSMPIPKELKRFAQVLRGKSKILALPDEPVSGSAIYNAYGADLELLTRYRAALHTTIEAGVRARADNDDEAQKFSNG